MQNELEKGLVRVCNRLDRMEPGIDEQLDISSSQPSYPLQNRFGLVFEDVFQPFN